MQILTKLFDSKLITKHTQSKREKQRRVKPVTNQLYKITALVPLQKDLVYKQKINAYDQLFRYYNVKMPIPISLHKIFILMEMQINAALTRAKLIPFMFIVQDLCKLGVIHVNGNIAANQFHLLHLWDVFSIPIPLYNRANYRLKREQKYPHLMNQVFKRY